MKRQRSEVSTGNSNPPWWNRVVHEIRSAGGFVHECLEFEESCRELKISSRDSDDAVQNDVVDPDTVLFKIPIACMVTRQRALEMCPWLQGMQGYQKLRPEKHTDDEDHNDTFFFDVPTDVMIAMAMASASPEQLLYLQTLPPSASFDALPRRWSDDKIRQLLQNTSIFDRVQHAKAGTQQDYEISKKIHENACKDQSSSTKQLPFPSFEKFSDMLAAVTSRAFQLGDSTKDIALVPLLDLSNHSRGKNEKKNVTYPIVVQNDDGNSNNTFMKVKAATTIRPGECLRITYGALGNAQLLLNYGFCIPHNIEPDGSSNDVLELKVATQQEGDIGVEKSTTTILLQAGPKAYSYSGFKAALDAFTPKRDSPDDANEAEEHSVQDDFECFLNQAEEEENDEEDEDEQDGFADLYDTGHDGGDNLESNDNNSPGSEKDALLDFQKALIRKYDLYKCNNDPLERALAMETGPEKFAAILCLSEQRTIYFFLRAIEKVVSKLCPNDAFPSHKIQLPLSQDDLISMEQQTTELTNAYTAIREAL